MVLDTDFSRVPAEPDIRPGKHHERVDVLASVMARIAIADADGDVELADPLDHWDEVHRE